MSFTSIVKNEISKQDFDETNNTSLLSAIVSNSIFDNNSIKVSTENASVARYVYNLFKSMYNISPAITVRKGYNYNKKLIYILEIHNKVSNILNDIGLSNNEIPKSFIIDDLELIRYYLKGVFLLSGSINDPKTSRYHLEFVVDSEEYAIFLTELLNKYNLNAKYLKHENKYMIYIKEAEKIGDFLRLMNAINALFYYEDIRIYRDHKNMTNRLNNCEQANVDKMIESASKEIQDIELIESIGGIDLLDDKVKEVAIYRKKYPEVSLQELSEIISVETGNPITKSGLHHRLKKIKDLANRIRNSENNE